MKHAAYKLCAFLMSDVEKTISREIYSVKMNDGRLGR